MPRLIGIVFVVLLSGCSNLPAHNPQQAWIDISSFVGDSLLAEQLDGQPWAAGDYYQVTPGAHTLGLNFQYFAGDQDSNNAEQLSCNFNLSYEAFKAGDRYGLVAGWGQAGAWLRLLNERGEQLAYDTCGAF